MLSIEECRKLIDDSEKYTDEEIVEIRKDLYEMAELALEVYFEKKKRGVNLKE
jgi:hypothetical protein